MQRLHVVGFTQDNQGLILSVRRGTKHGAYTVDVDAAFEEALTDLMKERGADTAPRIPRAESQLSVREMQQRLRSGQSIRQVARAAGVDDEWVARFAIPIQAEQNQVVRQAFNLVMSKQRLGDSSQNLGTSVWWNLQDKSVQLAAEEWDAGWSAALLRDSRWVVKLEYEARKRKQVAEWEVDLKAGTVTARNRLGGDLGYVESGRRRRPGPPPPAGGGLLSRPAPPIKDTPAPPPVVEAATTAPRRRAASTAATRRAPTRKKAAPGRAAKSTKRAAGTNKAVAKKSATRGAPAKKATTRATAPKKAVPKRTAAKKSAATKGAPKKAAARRAAPNKAAAKRAPARKKAAVKKGPAKRKPAPARIAAAAASPAKRVAVRSPSSNGSLQPPLAAPRISAVRALHAANAAPVPPTESRPSTTAPPAAPRKRRGLFRR